MAECHPVGFQWVMEAKARGAKVYHVDPRFTRTSALADRHLPIRAGSDIVLLGALINHVLTHGLDFREYVLAYTNAATIVWEDFGEHEDLDGLFAGRDPETTAYDPSSWAYKPSGEQAPAGQGEGGDRHAEAAGPQSYGSGGPAAHPSPHTDPTLTH